MKILALFILLLSPLAALTVEGAQPSSKSASKQPAWSQLTPEQQKKTDRILRQAYSQPQRAGQKIGRNEPCPCGSGKQHKKCCLGKERG